MQIVTPDGVWCVHNMHNHILLLRTSVYTCLQYDNMWSKPKYVFHQRKMTMTLIQNSVKSFEMITCHDLLFHFILLNSPNNMTNRQHSRCNLLTRLRLAKHSMQKILRKKIRKNQEIILSVIYERNVDSHGYWSHTIINIGHCIWPHYVNYWTVPILLMLYVRSMVERSTFYLYI